MNKEKLIQKNWYQELYDLLLMNSRQFSGSSNKYITIEQSLKLTEKVLKKYKNKEEK